MHVLRPKIARGAAGVIAAPLVVLLLTGSSDCEDHWPDAPHPDHGQKWIGSYGGTADVFWCDAGTNEEGLAAFLDIRRVEGNEVIVELDVASGTEYVVRADAIATASGSSRLVGRRHRGDIIDEFTLTLHGNVVTGTHQELRRTPRGTEYCTLESTLDVRRTWNTSSITATGTEHDPSRVRGR